ncbi:Ig-like domain repeat protein [Burkholderia theae]|uniref:Ig-like domain repeat protein n=1 Tax=Burkholderia theae TaxID=3143496 RepID=UPI003AFA92E0
MVAIVSGNNLGLNLGSFAVLGSNGKFGNAVQGRSGESAYVNVANGNLVLQDNDALLMGLGLNISDLRTYNSQGTANFTNGDGWQTGLYKSVVRQSDGTFERTDSDGSTSIYAWDATSQGYVETTSAGSALSTIRVNADGTLTWTNGSTGTTETYEGGGSGLLLSSTDTDGNTLAYSYDRNNLLTRVTDASGETLNFTYSGQNLIQLSTTLASGQRINEISYSYDTQNRLTSVAVNLNPTGAVPAGADALASYVTTYTYDGTSDRIAGVQQSDGTNLAFTYVLSDGQYKIATVTDGLGNTTSFAYDSNSDTTSVTDPLDCTSVYRYDANGRLIQASSGVTAANAAGLTQAYYAYNGLGDVTSITDGAGHTVSMQYDSRGNLMSQVDAAGDTRTLTYNAANQILTNTAYANAASGLEAASDPQTTRYVYSAAQPTQLRFVITPQGDVTEYRYSANGLRTATIVYTGSAYDVSQLGQTQVPTEGQLEQWQAAQDLTQTGRTDYTYDFRGQLQASTTYADIGSDGTGIASGEQTTQYVYDQSGHLLQTVSSTGSITRYIYDGLGRIVCTSAPSLDGTTPNVTLTSYNDASGTTTVTLANGLSTVSSYDRAGHLVSVAQLSAASSSLGTTRYWYDADGRLVMTQDPTGARQWAMYDEAGRKIADIDPTGALTEYAYNASGLLAQSIAYDTPVDTSALVDASGAPLTAWTTDARWPTSGPAAELAAIRPASTSQDQHTWYFYDDADRLTWQVDAQGRVTQTTYDGESHVLSVTQLANPIDVSQLASGTDVSFASQTVQWLTVTTNGSSALGTPMTLQANVNGGNGGEVTFFNGSTILGSTVMTNGTASFTTSALPAGVSDIHAVYSGDASHPSGVSAVTQATVTGAATNVAVSWQSPGVNWGNAPTWSSPVTLSAAVTDQVQGLPLASGQVTFYNGTTVLGTATLVNGLALLTLTDLPVGQMNFQAVYAGDATHAGANAQGWASAVARSTTTTLQVSGTASTLNLQASVSALTGLPAAPTGTVTFYNGSTALGTTTLVNGTASFVYNGTLSAAPLSAVYSGDTDNVTSTSVTMGRYEGNSVPLSPTETTLSASASSITQGTAVTLTANVAGAVPSGLVTFFSGMTLLGTAEVTNGVATLVTDCLPAGTDVLTATYTGDANNAGSVVEVGPTVQVTAAAGAPQPPTVSSNSSLAMWWSADNTTGSAALGIMEVPTGQSTGTLSVFDGQTLIASLAGSSNQHYVYLPSMSPGTHNLTLVYSGDADTAAQINTQQVVVGVMTPPVTLGSSCSPATAGAPVTLTAAVQPPSYYGGPLATGTITFYSNGTAIGTASVVDGVATLETSSLTLGTNSVTASYSGDALLQAATSATLWQAIDASTQVTSTSTTLTTSQSSANYGAGLTLTASVKSSTDQAAILDGTVSFYNGATLLGTATLVNGQASLTVNQLPVGTNALTAAYSGDAQNATSVSTLSQTVTQSPTTTTLTASATSITQGTAVTLTANVAGAAPSGLVTFFSGMTPLGTAEVTNGVATLVTDCLPAGTDVLTAAYTGDANNQGSAVATGPTVQVTAAAGAPQPPTVSSNSGLTMWWSDGNTDGNPALTIMEAPRIGQSPPPTGTFNVFDGQTLIASVPGSSNERYVYLPSMSPGTHNLTVVYSGDPNNVAEMGTLQVVMGTTTPSVALSSSCSQATAGAPVTLTAAVQPGSNYSGPSATGTVTFYSNGTAIGTASVVNGVATLETSGLALGTDSLTASYSGDALLQSATSATFSQQVVSQPPATWLSFNPSALSEPCGSASTIQITVGGQGNPPTGTVSVYDGTQLLSTASVTAGEANVNVGSLAVGAHNLNVVYSGDDSNAGSTGNVSVTVTPAASTLSNLSASTVTPGGALSVQVAGANPTGLVNFFNGTTLLGTAQVVNGVATLTGVALPMGTWTCTAAYSGDTNNTQSVVQFPQTVANPAEPVTASWLKVTTNGPSALGTPMTLQANVSGGNGGEVTFFNGSTILGSAVMTNGTASFTTSALPVGVSDIHAVYSGDASHPSGVSAVTQATITGAATNVAVSWQSPGVNWGNAPTWSSPVTLSAAVTDQVQGLPLASGQVTFYNGTTVLGTATLVNGLALLTLTDLPVGQMNFQAVYAGDATHAGANAQGWASAVARSTTTTLQVSGTASTLNLQASVSALTGLPVTPTGTVTFYNGSTALGTTTLVNGTANFSYDGTLSAAPLSAVYSGDTDNVTSTSVTMGRYEGNSVPLSPTETTLSASASSITQGTAVTLTANVAGAAPSGLVTFFSGMTLLGTAEVTNGVATLVTDCLPAGTDVLTATYTGDANNQGSAVATGPTVQVTAAAGAPQPPTVSSNNNLAMWWADTNTDGEVALGIEEVPTGQSPATGTFSVFDGQTLIASLAGSSNQHYVYLPSMSPGTHNLTLVYSGDADTAAQINTQQVVVGVMTPPVTLGSSCSPATAGAPVTLTAAVQPPSYYGGPLATGTITFYSNGTAIGTASVVDGVATLETSSLTLGTNSVTASYSGDALLQAATSATLWQAIDASTQVTSTSTTLTTSQSSANYGAGLTLTASVKSSTDQAAILDGTVSFYNGATLLGTATLVNGQASLTVNQLPVGTNALTAAYSGDAQNATSVSTLSQTVTQSPTTTTLTASATSITQGTAVTLTANVAGAAPSGLVTFFSGMTPLGTAEVTNGVATLVTDCLPAGTDVLTAAYTGDANNQGSAVATGPTVQVTAAAGAPQPPTVSSNSGLTMWWSDGNTDGNPALTIMEAPRIGQSPPPTGTFNVFDGQTLIASVPGSSNERYVYLPSMSPGTHNLTVVYSGDPNNVAEMGTLQVVMGTTTPSVALSSSCSQATAGAPVTLTAAVQPGSNYSGPSATGTVTFYSNGTAIGTASVVNGVATLETSGLALGTDSLTASYSGDALLQSATSATFSQQVVSQPPATWLSFNPSALSEPCGSASTIQITVGGQGNPPTGTVSVYDGTQLLSTASVTAGEANVNVGSLAVGAHNLNVVYSGDDSNAGSTGNVSVTVTPAASTLSNLSASTVTPGGALSVQVAGANPTGLVNFFNGTTLLGTAQVVNGVATLTGAALPTGTWTCTAAYSGDTSNVQSTLSFSQTVGPTPQVAVQTTPDASLDRTITDIYNPNGQLFATIDADGYITQYCYDSAGRETQTIQYATAVPDFGNAASFAAEVDAARASGNLGALLPPASTSDIHTYSIYNARAQIVGRIDGDGYLTETVYDANGNVTQTIRYATAVQIAPGATLTLAAVRPSSSPADQVVTQTWNSANELQSSTAADGTVTSYKYDSMGNVIEATTALGTSDQRTVMTRYDVQGRVIAELSGDGAALITGNQTQAQIDAIWNQYAVTYTYDAAGRRLSATDANGNRTTYFYDDAGRLRFTVNAAGDVTEDTYDALGHLVSKTQYATALSGATLSGLQGGLLSAATNQGAVTALQNARDADVQDNSVTQYAYDDDGELIQTTDAMGGVTSTHYDTFGDAVQTTETISAGRSVISTASYDRRGLQTGTVADTGGVAAATSVQYDAFGRVIASTDANGNVTHTSYDALGRVIATTDAAGSTRSSTYDAFGRVLTQTDALGNTTTYTYDTAARTVTTTTPDGISVTVTHNREGQTLSVTDGNGNTTAYTYDADGNLLSTVTPLATTTNQYDAGDRLISSTDANGVATTYTYDAANRLLSRTLDPDGLALTTQYAYDAKSEQISVTDPNGNVTQNTYDLKGEVLTQTVDPDGLALTTSYSYDQTGHVVTMTNPGGTVTQYIYDDLGRRVMTQVDPSGLNLTTRYAYDANGNMVSSTDGDGNVVRYTYDADNRVVYTVDGAGDVTHYVYDWNGNVIQRIQYANRVSGYTGGVPQVSADAAHDVNIRTVYDAQNRAIFTVDGTGAVTQQVYDGNGNVLEKIAYATPVPVGTPATASSLSAAVANIADPLHDESERYVFDAANRVVWSVNGVGAVTHYTYDGDGNVTSKIAYATALAAGADPSTVAVSNQDEETDWIYDAANRVIYQLQVTDHADDVIAGVSDMRAVTSYQYDANGNRIRTVECAWPLPNYVSSSDVQNLYDNMVVAPQLDRVQTDAYDAAGRLVYSQDASGAITQYAYDGADHLISTTQYAQVAAVDESFIGESDGVHGFQTTTPNAAAFAQMVTATPGQDRTTQYAYDGAGRQVYRIDALGYVTQTSYDGVGRAVGSTLYANAVAVNAQGNPSVVAAAIVAVPSADETTSSVFDAAGNLVTSTDALGHTQQYAYNGVGDRLAYTNQNGATWTYDYDAAGRVVSETAPAVDVTAVAQDGNGNLVQSGTSSTNIVTVMSYDALGNLTSRTEAAGTSGARTTQYVYDALGRQIETIYPPVGVYDASADALNVNGEGAAATRTDTTQTLYSQVFYDTLGNAVADRDVSGNYTYKVYDRTGQLRYDIDALGYVTAYQRDVFGDQVGLTRYANSISTANWGTTPPVDADMATLVDGLGSANDRTITTNYDQLGRAVQVTQPEAWADNGAGQSGMASEVTKTTYNAFGNVVQTSALADASSNTWATTTYYYDLRGQQAASVDALGYVTTQQFDAAGNVVVQTQYASATSGWSTSGYTTPAASSQDRETTYDYDQANRKVGQTLVGVTYSTASDGSSVVGNLTTTYGYDAVGNLTRATDALGNSTYTYYDALGRVIATAQPPVSDTANGQALIPLATYARDAYGNVVAKTQYVNGAAWANQSGYAIAGGSSADRATLTEYDSHGNAIETTDADGNSHFMSYNAAGQLAKDWQSVQGIDGVVHTIYTVYQYDALGRQTAIITPNSDSVVSGGGIAIESQAQAGSLTTSMVFDSFGDMVQRGSYATGGAPQYQEYFDYDNAGRLWRTNSGDGTAHVTLYDLLGFKTADITSAGSEGGSGAGVDLSQSASAQAVDEMGSNGLRRTDMQVDLLGRTVTVILPMRQDSTDAVAYRPVVYQTYDRWNNVLSQSDARDSAWITYYGYNWNNQVVERIQPDENGQESGDSPVTQIYYDALGRQVAIRDADGNVNGQVWDANGNLQSELHADGGVVTHEYDAFGEQVRLVDADGNVTDYGYDNMGRDLSITNEGVGVYVSNGQGVSGGIQNLTTYSTYDAAGRKLTQVDGTGAVTRFTYDLLGNEIATTDADGYASYSAYNAQGKQVGSQDADGAVATWSYDYFGKLTGHTDIGGASYAFNYDNARQLVSQTNTRGQNLSYTYDAAGQLVQINDAALNQQTYYSYNAAGQHVLEETVQGGVAYQNQTLGYDTLGRLSIVNTADGVSIVTDYDKVGNKMHEHITVPGQTAQDLFFAYDSMNRQILVDGAVDNNASNLANITPGQGHILAYDHNGNRIEDRSWGTQVTPQYAQNHDEAGAPVGAPYLSGYASNTGIQTTWYTYDSMNRLSTVATGAYGPVQTGTQQVQTGVDESGAPVYTTEPAYTNEPLGRSKAIVLDTRLYDGASRVVQSGPDGSLPAAYVQALTNGNLDLSGAATTVSQYDADGRLLSQAVTNEADPSSSSTTQYTTYDAAGNLEAYQTTQGVNGDTIVTDTTISLARYDGYVETSQQAVSTNESSGNQTSGSTTESYDANGHLTSVVDSATPSNSRTLVNDAQGHVLDKMQQGELHELVVNGEVIGIYGQDASGAVANFDLAYTKVTNSYPAAATGQYPVKAGDTLQSIAQAAYGDSSLWYLIADANGLKGNSDLKVGQVLNIPTRVGDVHNNAGTFAPYNAQKIVGSTSPQLPVPAGNADSGGGCGPIGEIIMAVVAVVATIYTAGAASVAFGLADSAVAAGESTFAIGLDTLGGSLAGASGLEMAGAAAVGGAVGSVASQAVGDATGASSGFSWEGVALGALGAGIGAGVGAEASTLGIGGSGIPDAVGRAALGSVVAQGIGVTTGLQHSFSWQGVAAAAVSAGVGSEVGQSFGASDFANSLSPVAANAARVGLSSVAGDLTASVMNGGHIDVAQIAGDAFGNALGESLAGENLAANGNSGGNPFAAQTENQINVGNPGDAALFGPMGNATQWGGTGSSTSGFDTSAAYNQLVGAFGEAQNGYGSAPGMLLAANTLTEPGQPTAMSDAGNDSGINFGINGIGWSPSSTMPTLADGTQVFESTDPNDQRLLVQGSVGGAIPTVPGYQLSSINSYGYGSQNYYYTSALTDAAGQASQELSIVSTDPNTGAITWNTGSVSYPVPTPDVTSQPLSDAGAGMTGTIRPLSDWDSFLTFNPAGRFMAGLGNGVSNLFTGLVNTAEQGVLTAGDAVSYGLSRADNALGGNMGYQPQSALGITIQNQGAGETALNVFGSVATGAVNSVFGPINALYHQDATMLGQSTVGLVAMAAPAVGAESLAGDVATESVPEFFGARGPASGRLYDPTQAGGPIQQLTTDGVQITHDGIDTVEQHIARFGQDNANDFMVNRLRGIANGNLEATQYDLNYYTHELTEFQRYTNLGWEVGQPADPTKAYQLWNNAHTATLEDFGLKDGQLYHPDAPQ